MSARRGAIVKRLVVAGLGLVTACALAIAVRAARAELLSLEPTHYRVQRPSGESWLVRATDIALHTRQGVAMRGWRFASTNGAAVVLVHGSGADRRQLLPEARILTEAGYGVLLFDLPGNAESGGQRRRGDDQEFIHTAIDALASSVDVRPQRIGAFGFSTGAAMLAGVAADDPRVRGVVLAGCYTDTADHVRRDYRRWGPVSGLPALWAARWAGLVSVHPLQSVPRIAPRSVMFVAGDADPVVPYDSSQQLYAAAREPKQLWLMPGAGHGNYAKTGAHAYAVRLVAFFDQALSEHAP